MSTPSPAPQQWADEIKRLHCIGQYVRSKNIICHEYPIEQVPLDEREKKQVGELNALFTKHAAALSEENGQLREQLRLANIDAANESAEANDRHEWAEKLNELQPAIESLTTDCEERYNLSSVSTKHLSALLSLLASHPAATNKSP